MLAFVTCIKDIENAESSTHTQKKKKKKQEIH